MESTQDIAFQIIMHAGNGRSSAMEAVYCSREGDFGKASELLAESKKEMQEAHHIQMQLLVDQANGEKILVDPLLAHALDHMTMATLTYDMAEEIVLLRKERTENER